MSDFALSYIITAKGPNGACTTTHRERTGAMALADTWASQGYMDVLIADLEGVIYDRDAFRSTITVYVPFRG
ncbi:hypothetical protein ACRAWG_35490 [Methylobacterium sp. P31]